MAKYLLGDRPDWYDEAQCMGLPLETFFGDEEDQQEHGSHRPYLLPAQVQEAKAVCLECPVIEACLQYADDLNIEHGIWGGMHWKERQKIREAGYRPLDILRSHLREREGTTQLAS